MKKVCPRCKNFEIKPTDKYCKICGLLLKDTGILVDTIGTNKNCITPSQEKSR